MKITTRNAGENIYVLNLNGYIDASNSHVLEEACDQLLAKGKCSIVLNFREVGYVSSAGLRVLLTAAKQMEATGGALKLCELNATVNKILDLSGLSQILNISANEKESLEDLPL